MNDPADYSLGGAIIVMGRGGASVAAAQSTASTTFVDLATVGPVVSLRTRRAVIVVVSATSYRGGGGADYGVMGVAVTGATTLAAAANPESWGWTSISDYSFCNARTFLLAGLTPGVNIFTVKYRVGIASALCIFERRSLAVLAL